MKMALKVLTALICALGLCTSELRADTISAGAQHTVVVTPDGIVWTWGSNAAGQLGDGTNTSRTIPAAVPVLTGITAVAAGGHVTSDRVLLVHRGSSSGTGEPRTNAAHAYDAQQRRVRIVEREGGVTQSDTKVVWCDEQICEERAADGTTGTRRAFGVGEQVAGSARFFAADHLGSVTEVADASATLLGRYAFDRWGRRTSVVSAWEVAITVAGGKLRLAEPPVRWFLGLNEHYDLREVPLDAGLACAAAALPPLHRDPFDRVIVALAQAHGLTVLTSDQNIRKYPAVTTLW